MSHGVGPDDLLARDGSAAITKVITDARPADPERHLQVLLRAAQDPMQILGEILENKPVIVAMLERGAGCQLKAAAIYGKHKAKMRFNDAVSSVEQELSEQDSASGSADTSGAIYSVIDGVFHVQEGKSLRPLANFVARVVIDHIVDDGVQPRRYFEIEGTTAAGEVLPRIRVTPTDFDKLSWWTGQWGTRPIAEVGRMAHDHLRVAILKHSTHEQHTSYSHTGWRLINEQWVYLHGGGAVGAAGIDVALDGRLSKITLPDEPQDPAGAMQLALEILEVAPDRVSFPLLLAPFRAILLEVLPIDGAIHLAGRTGTLKSSAAALIQSFFGPDFTHDSLPASFADTYASLERKCHLAKDALIIADEYVPRTVDSHDEARKKMAQLVRMIGNGAPRGRMGADLVARSSFPPRSLVVTTGEEVPDGESTVARLMVISFDSTTINRTVLSKLQATQHRLSDALVGYIKFLAPRLEVMRTWASQRHLELRNQFARGGGHLRAPSMAAHLALAADAFANYALVLGVFDRADARYFIDEAHKALEEAMHVQTSETRQENPARRFLQLLNEMLVSGRARVVKRSESLSSHAGDADRVLGWEDPSKLWLLPNQTYAAVADFARQQGHHLPIRAQAVWRGLRELGAITAGDNEHLTVQREIHGRRHRVLELPASALGRADEEEVFSSKVVDRESSIGSDDSKHWQEPENDESLDSERVQHRTIR